MTSPPFDAVPPSLEAVLDDLRSRVDSLERWQQADPDVRHRVEAAFTSFPSPVWRPPAPVSFTDVWASAATAVGADTTFEVRRNGTTFGTVTISNGETVGFTSLAAPVTADIFDVIDCVRTDGSDDATVQALGTSAHPFTPTLGAGTGLLPKAVCSNETYANTDP